MLYARIAPGVPYSLVNYAAGATRLALRAARVREGPGRAGVAAKP